VVVDSFFGLLRASVFHLQFGFCLCPACFWFRFTLLAWLVCGLGGFKRLVSVARQNLALGLALRSSGGGQISGGIVGFYQGALLACFCGALFF